MSGQPLNCTDIEVGPDGVGVLHDRRPRDAGRAVPGELERGQTIAGGRTHPLDEALEIDSQLSSFSQKRLSLIKRAARPDLGTGIWSRWPAWTLGPSIRIRALDLLAQLGPPPSDELLSHARVGPGCRGPLPGGRFARPTVVGDEFESRWKTHWAIKTRSSAATRARA